MNYSHEKALQAILHGRSCALKLKQRLDDPTADDGSVSSSDLAQSIVDCFSDAISNLFDKSKSGDDVQFSDLSSNDSSLSPHLHSKKRKITSQSSRKNWRDDSPVPIYYDGFLWRKYGQKYIKKSDHQRSYYRCTYNKDQQCEATKHEELIKDNPPVYRTTYFGHHTCKLNHEQDAMFSTAVEPVEDLKNARMIRFGKDLDRESKNYSDGFSLSVKHEEYFIKEENMDQYHEMLTSDDQDVLKENLSSSPSGSSDPPSSGIESDACDSELIWDNLYSCDYYDQFEFGELC